MSIKTIALDAGHGMGTAGKRCHVPRASLHSSRVMACCTRECTMSCHTSSDMCGNASRGLVNENSEAKLRGVPAVPPRLIITMAVSPSCENITAADRKSVCRERVSFFFFLWVVGGGV